MGFRLVRKESTENLLSPTARFDALKFGMLFTASACLRYARHCVCSVITTCHEVHSEVGKQLRLGEVK